MGEKKRKEASKPVFELIQAEPHERHHQSQIHAHSSSSISRTALRPYPSHAICNLYCQFAVP